MQAELIMEPGVSIGWREFVEKKPPSSIALDGYVHRGPRHHINKKGLWMNCNHHEDVYRPFTRATCSQVYFAINQVLFDCCGELIRVYANDCDQDIATSWTLINNGQRPEFIESKLVYKLVMAEDTLDTFAGAYPFPSSFVPMMKRMAWIFEPYSNFRSQGRINEPFKDPEMFKQVVFDVEARFLQSISGKGKTIPLDVRYEKFGGNSKWIVAREVGIHAKTGIFRDRYHTYALFRQNSIGKFYWVFGKLLFAPFDLAKLMSLLNELEGTPGDSQPYGGGNTIFGNRNSQGSSIGPDRMANIMDEVNRYSNAKMIS